MDLSEYRNSAAERERTDSLLSFVPPSGRSALDIGARDGHFSVLLAERFDRVVALDLAMPSISHPRVTCVSGNVVGLEFPDASFDLVFCAEVLEHIPTDLLQRACAEIERVCRGHILIGVPYKQDLRVGRTTCYACRGKNPPWGHVNSFDEHTLARRFPNCRVDSVAFVGTSTQRTNAVSALLMDWAGNPYGTYTQDEPCIHCNRALVPPPARTLAQKVLTKLAFWARGLSDIGAKPHANWMHMRLVKNATPVDTDGREAGGHGPARA